MRGAIGKSVDGNEETEVTEKRKIFRTFKDIIMKICRNVNPFLKNFLAASAHGSAAPILLPTSVFRGNPFY
jgi:hypothetical protein